MRFVRKLVPLVAGLMVAAGVAAPAANAGQPITGLVSDVASDMTPAVPGGQCYPKANQDLCRRVLVLQEIDGWVYAGGIISSVIDRSTGKDVTINGFHNIFRFNPSTGAVDASWQPQFYKSSQNDDTTAYLDSAVSGIAAGPSGTIYVSGKFTQVATTQGAAGVQKHGVAQVSTTDPPVVEKFNAHVGEGGGGGIVYDVADVDGIVWLGGLFTHVANQAVTALAFVNPTTGALTGTQIPISGQVTTTVGTKVTQFAINPQVTKAAMIGNYTSVGGASHWEVVVLDISSTGGVTVDSWNDPTNLQASNSSNCHAADTWARAVDWDPSGQYFDIGASGGGGFDAFGQHGALCDAFSRFDSTSGSNTPYPLIVNETGFDSLFAVDDTGQYVYTGGHNHGLNHGVYINGAKVKATFEDHYGIGVIDVDPSDPGYGMAVTDWNNNTTTGRGAGWASSLSITGCGVYIGGDAQTVGSDTTIQRLAYFPVSGTPSCPDPAP